MLDRLLAAVTAEYGDELARAGRSPEQRRLERVKRLLDGGAAEHAELDYDLRGWHLGAIALGAGAGEAVRELAGDVGRRLLRYPRGARACGRGSAAASDSRRRRSRARSRVWRWALAWCSRSGSRPVESRVGGSPTVRREAALLVALRRHDPSGVTGYGEVALLASRSKTTRSRSRSSMSISRRSIASATVARSHARRCARTSPPAAARPPRPPRWATARNTVENRLRTVEQCLGRSLHTCLSELEVALGLEPRLGDSRGDASPLNEAK